MAASAANCKNFKANSLVNIPALLRRRGICSLRLINRRGHGFNPPGSAAAHKLKIAAGLSGLPAAGHLPDQPPIAKPR
jgi:hypothetical protein